MEGKRQGFSERSPRSLADITRGLQGANSKGTIESPFEGENILVQFVVKLCIESLECRTVEMAKSRRRLIRAELAEKEGRAVPTALAIYHSIDGILRYGSRSYLTIRRRQRETPQSPSEPIP